MPWRDVLRSRLPQEIAALFDGLSAAESEKLGEIRIFEGRRVVFVFDGISRVSDVPAPRMDDLLAALCGYALYSAERQMAMGYIPLPGGHRAGVCGRMTREKGEPAMASVTSVCIRIARQIDGASRPLRAHLLDTHGRLRRVLLLGPPGCGKTTILRDAALYLCDEIGLHIAAADEREELFSALPAGRGLRLDVIAGEEKGRAIMMLLRSMAPQGIVTDEIGSDADACALKEAARCGVGLLASAHAGSMEDMLRRPTLKRLYEEGVFERYVFLERRGAKMRILDECGQEVGEGL